MDEDDLTVDDRFRSRDIGKGSGDIISAFRDIIDADGVAGNRSRSGFGFRACRSTIARRA